MDIGNLIKEYLVDQEDGMRKFLTCFLNCVMLFEATQQAGAIRYERTGTRTARRNGTKKRSLRSLYGMLSLDKPEFRDKPFKTVVFEKYSRIEKSLINAILESYVQGVSTRSIRKVMEKMGIEGVSAETVSNLGKQLDEKVQSFLHRPIEHPIVYLIIDAVYIKVRCDCKYINQAVLIVAGIREDGFRELLGVQIADNEGEGFWLSLFEDLKERGLRGVQMITSDGHKGIQSAVKMSFLGASWQMCQVHYLRAILRKIPKNRQAEVILLVKSALNGNEDLLPEVAAKLVRMGFQQAANTVELFMFDIGNYRAFPKSHWKRIRTTNMVERVNAEIKRRTKVVNAFPSRDSLLRLSVSILIDINEEWVTGNRYLDMTEFLDKQILDAESGISSFPECPVVSIADQ